MLAGEKVKFWMVIVADDVTGAASATGTGVTAASVTRATAASKKPRRFSSSSSSSHETRVAAQMNSAATPRDLSLVIMFSSFPRRASCGPEGKAQRGPAPLGSRPGVGKYDI